MIKSKQHLTVFLISFLLFGIILLQSCNKKSATPTPTPSPTPVNYLCTGNGAANFMPLAVGNKWEYSSFGFVAHTEEVTGTLTMGGKSYFEVKYLSSIDNLKFYYRMATNGDIYKYNAADLAEYLFIPVNPTVGQVIATYVSKGYLKVASITASFSKGSCSYTNILQVEEYNSTNNLVNTNYFKKGLGYVGNTSMLGWDYLNAVTLK